MHRHRLPVQIRIRLQNLFQEMARADHRIEHPIRMVMLIDLRFHASQEALHAGIVDTLVFRAVPLLLSQAFLAQLAGRSLHQMVWTDELRIMRRVYDPNRSANIALLNYADGEKRYIIAPEGIKQGDVIETGAQADIKPGNNLPLKNIPTGTVVHAIELRPLGGAKIARSAGAAVQLVAKDGAYAQLRMPSGEIRNVDARCRATVGEVGNSDHANIQLGKAGRARWMGKRPITRGESMNPVDHPHGGRTRGGKPPVSPWGKGEVRTRRPKKASNKMIVRRRPNGKNRK